MHTHTTPSKRTLCLSRITSPAATPRRMAGILAVALFAASSLGALDYGANLESRSDIRGAAGELSPSFRTSAIGWFRHNPVVEGDATGRFFFESSVTNIARLDGDDQWQNDTVFDIDLLRLDGVFPGALGPQSVFRTRAGRFNLSEPSGLIFDDRADALSYSLELPRVTLTTAGGYTGLVRRANSAVAMTDDDFADLAFDPAEGSAPRLFVTAHSQFPELFAGQTLTSGVAAQSDRRSDDESPAEQLDTQYLFASLDGSVATALYYQASVSASRNELTVTGQEEDPTYGLGALLRGEWYLDAREASVVSFESRYTSGPQEGKLGSFVPVSLPAFDLLAPPDSGEDLALLSLDYALRPFAGQDGASARSLEASVYGAANFSADLSTADSYRGTEAGTRIRLRPFSDFGATLSLGGFFPGDAGADPQLLGRAELSTSY